MHFLLTHTLFSDALFEHLLSIRHLTTPAALSTNHTFSHTSRTSGRGGGTGLLISNKWKYNQLLPNAKYNTFEYHAILVTAPVKIYMVVVYRPPGQLGDFLDELDTLLSSIPEHDCPIMVLGDMNIHLDSPNSSDCLTLMHSFELQLVCSPPTHKAGKELDLIFTRNCTTEALSVTPLHFSDHFFIHFPMSLPGRNCFNPYGFLLPQPPQPAAHPLFLPRCLRSPTHSPPLRFMRPRSPSPLHWAIVWIICVLYPPNPLDPPSPILGLMIPSDRCAPTLKLQKGNGTNQKILQI